MKTGLFFGSFNPVHIGHMVLANYFVEYTDIDQLWFVISPHNPLKKRESLLNDQLRLEMVELAIGNDPRFRASDIEFHMPTPSYTMDTLAYLTEKNTKHEFVLLMGSDGLDTFHRWKNYELIISNYTRYVYPREASADAASQDDNLNIKFISGAPRIEISSSFIRKAIKENKKVDFFLPKPVFDFIDRYGHYR